MAQPRQCGLVRRIWIGDVPPPRRAREEMGDSERTLGDHRRRLSARRARARTPQFVRDADREPQSDARARRRGAGLSQRSEEHTSELQSLMRISYAVFCLKKK